MTTRQDEALAEAIAGQKRGLEGIDERFREMLHNRVQEIASLSWKMIQRAQEDELAIGQLVLDQRTAVQRIGDWHAD